MNLSLTDVIAVLALFMAGAAAFLTWKTHQDAGGRVKVRMNATAYVPFAGAGKLVRNHGGVFHLKETAEPAVELAQVVIENPGRTGVTVTGVVLRIEGTGVADYTVGPRAFSLAKFGAESADRDTYFRLEPYDRRTLLFDYWSVVDAQFAKDPTLREVTISAEVSVAGHDHPFDSKKHGYWRIQRDFVSAFGGHNIRRPRNIILTAFLRRHFSNLSDINYFDRYVVTAEETSDVSWGQEKLEAHLEELLEGNEARLMVADDNFISTIMVGWEISQEYLRLGDKVKAFPVPPHRAASYLKQAQARSASPDAD